MNDDAAVYMDLVAAKAKQLAQDMRTGRLWPSDFSIGVGEIQDALRKSQSSMKETAV